MRWLRARTKEALAAAKARVTRLDATRKGAGAVQRMRVAPKAQAAEFAANILPIIRMTGIGPVAVRCPRVRDRRPAISRCNQWWRASSAGEARVSRVALEFSGLRKVR